MKLILGVIETVLGGQLEDHYGAQWQIAEYAVTRRKHAQSQAVAGSAD